jgi:DNA-binding NarL/FixJ family response regulator
MTDVADGAKVWDSRPQLIKAGRELRLADPPRVLLAISSPGLRRRIRLALAAGGYEIEVPTENGRIPAHTGSRIVAVVEAGTEPSACGAVPVVAVVSDGIDALRASASGSNLRGIVERDDTDSDYATAVREVASGRGWVSPSLASTLLDALNKRNLPTTSEDPTAPAEELTQRESDVARMLAAGSSNLEVAESLSIAVSTVKFHVSNLLRKYGCRDRAQLAAALNAPTPSGRKRWSA